MSSQSDSSSLTVSTTQSGNNKDNNNQLATSQPPQSPSALSSSGDPMSFQLNSSLTLATLEKIKRFFFSKDEWQSYLLDKLDEEKRKKEGKTLPVNSSDQQTSDTMVLSWLRTVFPSQEEANSFLKSQLEQLEKEQNEMKEKKEKDNQRKGQQTK